MIFGRDEMTGTAGTPLNLHTPITGGSWIRHPSIGAGASLVLSGLNSALNLDGGACAYFINNAPITSTYRVSARLNFFTDINSREGIIGRANPAANTMYWARKFPAGGANRQLELLKMIAGFETTLAFVADGIERTGVLKLDIQASAKRVLWDDVQKISVADNDITDAGRAGIRDDSGFPPSTDTTGYHYDDFLAEDDSVDSGGFGAPLMACGPAGMGGCLTMGVGP